MAPDPATPLMPTMAPDPVASLMPTMEPDSAAPLMPIMSLDPVAVQMPPPAPSSSSTSHSLLATALAVNKCEPKTYKEAISSADSPRWFTAMQEEINLMVEQEVNIVSCKLVYKIKRDAKGNISPYKTRLVAQEFSQ